MDRPYQENEYRYHITTTEKKSPRFIGKSENECSPEQLRLVRSQKKLLVQKLEATVIATGSAYTASPETTPDTSPLPPTQPPSTLNNADTKIISTSTTDTHSTYFKHSKRKIFSSRHGDQT